MAKWEIHDQPRAIFGIIVIIIGIFIALMGAGGLGLPGFFGGFAVVFVGFLIMRSGQHRIDKHWIWIVLSVIYFKFEIFCFW